MVLTLADLERIREDAMAEDIDIEDRMLNWTEEQATTFFENGGEEEHEMTAWLRDHSCVQYDAQFRYCLLYTSPSPRDRTRSRMPSSA